MPEARLEKTRRLYDRVIDLGPMGCKVLDVGTPDNAALNAVFDKSHEHVHARWVFDIVRYEDVCRCGARRGALRIEGSSPWFFPEPR